jgi:hypothetical protein
MSGQEGGEALTASEVVHVCRRAQRRDRRNEAGAPDELPGGPVVRWTVAQSKPPEGPEAHGHRVGCGDRSQPDQRVGLGVLSFERRNTRKMEQRLGTRRLEGEHALQCGSGVRRGATAERVGGPSTDRSRWPVVG